jgi:hypothetical protein
LVLTDEGEVLAGSGDGLPELAAAGVQMLCGEPSAALGDADFFAHAVTVAGRPCVLASLGGRVDRVRRVQEDLARIFA